LCLSLVLLKPQYAPFLVIFLAWKRQWVQLQGFAAGAGIQALLTLAMFVVVGQAPSLESLQLFAGGGSEGPHVAVLNLTIRGAIWHLFPAMDGRLQLVLLAVLTLAAMGGFLAAIGREWDPGTRGFAWEILALSAFVCVTAFHSLLLNLYLILPSAVVLLAAAEGQPAERRWLAPALAGLLCVPSLGFAVSPGAYEPYYLAGWITAVGAVALGLVAHHALLYEQPTAAAVEVAASMPSPGAAG
jgi:hypothetical protein